LRNNNLGQGLLDFCITLQHLVEQMTVGRQSLPQNKQMLVPPVSCQRFFQLLPGGLGTQLLIPQLDQLLGIALPG